jgi:hypothetical protein
VLARVERALPSIARRFEVASAKVDPRVRHMDVGDLVRVWAELAREDRLGEIEQRQRFVVLVHVGDERCCERPGPPCELQRIGTVFALDAGDRRAHQPHHAVGIDLVELHDLGTDLRDRTLRARRQRIRGARFRQLDRERIDARHRQKEPERD